MKTINLINDYDREYELDEAYKTIRTNIMFCGFDTKVISITSCDSHDGKSTVSFEISRSLAGAGKKVLYIDADMRKSVFAAIHTNTKDLPGLSHFLSGQNNPEEVLFATDTENLFVVFSGVYPPNPAELLSGSRFAEFINEVRARFDFIIIDTPPLGLVSDAAACIARSDGAIMVLSSGKTGLKAAREVKKSIENTGTKLIGCILNNVAREARSYYAYKQ